MADIQIAITNAAAIQIVITNAAIQIAISNVADIQITISIVADIQMQLMSWIPCQYILDLRFSIHQNWKYKKIKATTSDLLCFLMITIITFVMVINRFFTELRFFKKMVKKTSAPTCSEYTDEWKVLS